MFNLTTILEMHSLWRRAFRFNEFANCVDVVRPMPWRRPKGEPFGESDASELCAWMGDPANFDLSCKSGLVLEAVEAVARRDRYNPLVDYLNSLTWDAKPRIATMFADFFGTSYTTYLDRCAHILMVSAVARAIAPGCKVDTMLVFEGHQGTGKTTALRALFGDSWYAEAKESPTSKDFYVALQGRWCVEIEEMESFSKADIHKVKQAISAQTDTFRPPYGRMARTFPRQCIFLGTTNEAQYLRDPTGARRFLPLEAPLVNVPALRAARDQLWAEAMALHRQGFNYWTLPEDAREEQDARYQADAWEDTIERWLHGPPGDSTEGWPPRPMVASQLDPLVEWDEQDGRRTQWLGWTTTTEIMSYALKFDLSRQGKPEQMRVAAAMRRLGWSQRQVGPTRTRRWLRDRNNPNNLTDLKTC